ncbi:MAG: hypothetical protein K0S07_543 [Chlamydiales bacterium]|jgi:hypothetical protein|nr:hypothetical protein [Chlamydiales bacterium]
MQPISSENLRQTLLSLKEALDEQASRSLQLPPDDPKRQKLEMLQEKVREIFQSLKPVLDEGTRRQVAAFQQEVQRALELVELAEFGQQKLSFAIRRGDLPQVKRLLELMPNICSYYPSPLFEAVESRQVAIAALLLEKGVPLKDARSKISPLEQALYGDQVEMVSLFLAEGASPEQKMRWLLPNKERRWEEKETEVEGTLLGFAVCFNQLEMAGRLLERGAAREPLSNGWTLEYAAQYYAHDEMNALLS